MSDSRVKGVLAAIERGNAGPESELPRFPKAARWDRDPEFDERVALLKAVRDEKARELDLDPGVLCARDRLEAVARKKPTSVEDFDGISELRRWQVEVLGAGFVAALSKVRATPVIGGKASSAGAKTSPANEKATSEPSPYRDES
jgi:ribonuclease D